MEGSDIPVSGTVTVRTYEDIPFLAQEQKGRKREPFAIGVARRISKPRSEEAKTSRAAGSARPDQYPSPISCDWLSFWCPEGSQT
jgi:hypothetical protein